MQNNGKGLRKINMEELRRTIAGSEVEIDDALEKVMAVEIDGTIPSSEWMVN